MFVPLFKCLDVPQSKEGMSWSFFYWQYQQDNVNLLFISFISDRNLTWSKPHLQMKLNVCLFFEEMNKIMSYSQHFCFPPLNKNTANRDIPWLTWQHVIPGIFFLARLYHVLIHFTNIKLSFSYHNLHQLNCMRNVATQMLSLYTILLFQHCHEDTEAAVSICKLTVKSGRESS